MYRGAPTPSGGSTGAFLARVLPAALASFLLMAAPAAAQEARATLTLARAESLALERNRGLEAQRARARAADARADGSGAFLLPSAGAEAGYTRSDDPVAAFGTKLRQARFTQADLALDALNHPDAVEDWTGVLAVRWEGLDATRWAGREAARAEAEAAGHATDRTAEGVLLQTRVLYLQVLRVRARLDAAEAARAAAEANRDLLRRRRDQGMLTDADVLRGEAALADAEARVVDARRGVTDARARLGHHLGMDDGALPDPSESLDDVAVAVPTPDPLSADDVDDRADVEASGAALEAARARRRQAGLARLPRVELFGLLSSHAPDAFDGREANTTLGVQLSIPLFTGGAIGAEQDAAEAMARATEAEHRELVSRARMEIREAVRAEEAAREGLDAALQARDAAREAARLVRRRFEEGMATTADLLQAEAEAARLRTAAVDARARLEMARARLAFELGDGAAGGPGAPGGDR